MKECEQQQCQDAMGVFERFYSSLPEGMQLQMIAEKFGEYRENVAKTCIECASSLCKPIIDVIAKHKE